MSRIQKLIHQWVWVVLLIFCMVGLIYPVIGIGALICMVAPVIGAFFKGRKWCGSYCPRGSFNDIVLSKLTFKKKTPALFKENWFRMVLLILILCGFGIQLLFAWGDLARVGQVFVRMIISTTLVAIFLGIGFSARTWCGICPMGTLAHYTAKQTSVKRSSGAIHFLKEKCIDCKACTKSCPMNIDVYSFKKEGRVIHGDCLQCLSCVEKCPQKSLYLA